MKKLFLPLLFCLFCALATHAQTTLAALAKGNSPEISFEKDSYDFGDIREGEVVSTSFIFTNEGSQPLVLTKVATTCGCTAPKWPREPIMPGESGNIEIQFDSAGKAGIQNKIITVYSNASTPQARVKIATNVLPKSR